jgi:hypothetical protein
MKINNKVKLEVPKIVKTGKVRPGSIITDENKFAYVVYLKTESTIYIAGLSDGRQAKLNYETLNNQFEVLVDPEITISAKESLPIEDK